MVDKSKKRKKGPIREEDVFTLLRSYSVNTVLVLLQEVANVNSAKIDWNAMVKNTASGISSAKEYQILWRHLAYGQSLIDLLDNDSNPMDDDSDLEYEVEAFPAVSREASADAAAYVKVLMASGHRSDSHISNNLTIDAPLTINIPCTKGHNTSSDGTSLTSIIQGKNISISVTVQKQPLSSGTCGEKRPNNATSGIEFPPRKKRRAWATEEDTKLTAAVQKYGERNWANIARGDFKNERKASELSQRWTSLKKKLGSSSVGTSSQLSETQLAAAHRAMSLALDMPRAETLKETGQINTPGSKPQLQSLKPSASRSDHHQFGAAGALNSQIPIKRLPTNHTTHADSMVKAAAVAAGARIATGADASTLIANSQNVVHIKTGASSVVKPSLTSIANQLPSNVHFIRNGLAKAPISSPSASMVVIPNNLRSGESQNLQGLSKKAASPAIHPNLASTAPALNVSSGVSSNTASIETIGPTKTAECDVVSASLGEMKELVKKDGDCYQADNPTFPPAEPISDHRSAQSGGKVENQSPASDEGNSAGQCASKEIQPNPEPNTMHKDLPCTSVVESEDATRSNSTTPTET